MQVERENLRKCYRWIGREIQLYTCKNCELLSPLGCISIPRAIYKDEEYHCRFFRYNISTLVNVSLHEGMNI